MNINEIQVKQGKIDCEGEITSKEESREFEKSGNKMKVCDAVLKDESGEIKLTLWNDDCDKVNVGDTVKITNGYCGEFQGEKQLSAGRFGELKVVQD